MFVEPVAEIHHGPLTHVAHQVGCEIGKQSFGEIKDDDGHRHLFEPNLLDQDIIQHRLDEVGETRRCDGKPHHGYAGKNEPTTVAPCLAQ